MCVWGIEWYTLYACPPWKWRRVLLGGTGRATSASAHSRSCFLPVHLTCILGQGTHGPLKFGHQTRWIRLTNYSRAQYMSTWPGLEEFLKFFWSSRNIPNLSRLHQIQFDISIHFPNVWVFPTTSIEVICELSGVHRLEYAIDINRPKFKAVDDCLHITEIIILLKVRFSGP